MKLCLCLFVSFLGLGANAQVYDPDFRNVYDLVSSRIDSFGRGASLARTMVRLAFHDAMGGVDALVDPSSSEHNGLATTVNELNTLWNDNQDTLSSFSSKADFFAWAYIAAFYCTVENTADLPWVPLRTGRTTYTSGRTEDVPPNSGTGSGDQTAVVDYFSTHFGLTERQFAVLLGAHTLGGADNENSGYVGDWTRSEDTFNTAYFNDLEGNDNGDDGWEQVKVTSSGKFQWRVGCTTSAGTADGNGCRRLMLNVDMNLFFDLDPYMAADGSVSIPPFAERPSSAPSHCGTDGRIWAACFQQRITDSNTVVEAFGGRNELDSFLDEFAEVYDMMISRVTDSVGLTVVQQSQPEGWPTSTSNGLPNRADCALVTSLRNMWNGAMSFFRSPP